MRSPSRSPAFSLIERLVVVAILGLLIAVILPPLSAARHRAKSATLNAREVQRCMRFIKASEAR